MANKYEEFFAEADKDGSGALSLNELVNQLRAKGYHGAEGQIKDMFTRADESGDAQITLEEYMNIMNDTPPPYHHGAAMRRVFREFDADGSGQIDRAELSKVFAEMGKHFSDEELQRMIKLCDEDDSGTLNCEEFITKVFGAQM